MSELRKMTRMGGDLRKIARLLQDKGRNGDTILAHINPREAALLREHGGSGEINPETGLMEFSDYSEGSSGYDPAPATPDYSNVPEGLFEGAAYTPEPSDQLFATRSLAGAPQAGTSYFDQAYGAGALPQLDRGPIPDTSRLATVRPLEETQAQIAAEPLRTGAGAPAEKSFLESLSGGDKARLGLAGVQGLSTALMANKARAGAQRGAEQIRQVGAPYTQQGLAERSAAQRGELTPVGQQQLDAMRARAAQAGVARGGVGVAQQQRAEEDLRQRLNAARESFGLQLSQIGDKYTMDAIKAGMQADAEVNQLYNQMFGNLARIAAPAAIQAGAK
jgi:hypothetical protein